MPNRKTTPDHLGPTDAINTLNGAPRSPVRSPSPGLGSFLSKPSKWFKSNSTTSSPSIASEPRSSTGSGRKHKISKPSDPRPILNTLKSEPVVTTASRSVIDLSITPSPFDPGNGSQASPRTPTNRSGTSPYGLGDLRNISRKTWSKSADDLLSSPVQEEPRKHTPLAVNTDFKDRVENYRKQSGPVSAGTESSASQHPFPSSSSPPGQSPLSGGHPIHSAISNTSPSPANSRNGVPQSHVRSHSFTPRLSSKLGPARSTTEPAPPLPTRPHLPSNASDREDSRSDDRMRSRKRTGSSEQSGSISSLQSSRAGFPWMQSGSHAVSPDGAPPSPRDFNHSPRKTAVSPNPPTILEPERSDTDTAAKTRRTSQIIHHSGFLNKLSSFVPPGDGSQTYWSAAPTTSIAKGWKPYKAVLKGSKLYFYKPPNDRTAEVKALFPESIVPDVEQHASLGEPAESTPREDTRKKRAYWGRGPHPELVREEGIIVRGSMDALIHEAVFGSTFRTAGQLPSEAKEAEWKTFASAVTLCLPQVTDRGKFEAELTRLCETLVSGAQEDVKAYDSAMVAWLATSYLDFHGLPVDQAAWNSFKREAIPDIEIRPAPLGNAFVPSQQATPDSNRLTLGEICKMDVHLVTRSLLLFHQRELGKLPERATLTTCLEPWDIASAGQTPQGLSLFSGCEDRPHWLTWLVIYHLFFPDVTGGGYITVSARPSQPPALPYRVAFWITVGELSRRSGDFCTWQAIKAALCSPPVARMSKLWHRVPPETFKLVDQWVQQSNDYNDNTKMQLPWLGGSLDSLHDDITQMQLETDTGVWAASTLLRAQATFTALQTKMQSCPRPVVDEESRGLRSLMTFWSQIVTDGPGQGAPVKLIKLSQAMSFSNALEPRRRGLVEPLYWTNPLLNRTPHPLVPVLFPEALPTITLLDRRSILAANGDSKVLPSSVVNLELFRNCRKTPDLRTEGVASIRQQGMSDMSGTELQIDDELIVVVVPTPAEPPSISASRASSRAPSRPPSSTPDPPHGRTLARKASRRMRPPSPTSLERKTSVNRRNSLPTPAPKPVELTHEAPTSEKPLTVAVHAATLDRLVKLLIHGLERVTISPSDDSGETPLKERTARELKLDSEEFKEVWWSGYRTFVTPLVFFELLRKEYVTPQDPTSQDSSRQVHSRRSVLHIMEEWIESGGGALDVLHTPELQTTIQAFLEADIHHVSGIEVDQPNGVLYHQSLASFKHIFATCIQRPPLHNNGLDIYPGNRNDSGSRTVPDFDTISAAELVTFVDSIGRALMGKIINDDILDVAEMLEVQTLDLTGWYSMKDVQPSVDVDIQNIQLYMMKGQLQPSTLIAELGQDQFYRLLPTSLRACIRAHEQLSKWIIAKLSERRLGHNARCTRLEKLFKALELSRTAGITLENPNDPVVRSFAEAILSRALLSPEVRSFIKAWQDVASHRTGRMDSLSSLLVPTSVPGEMADRTLTVDLGWFLERMMEAVAMPNVIEDSQKPLINLDKRRILNGLTRNLRHVAGISAQMQSRAFDIEMEKLQTIEAAVSTADFDIRSIRQVAQQESNLNMTSMKKTGLPLARLVFAQEEKNRRDRTLRDRLQKEKRAEQQRNEKREDELNRAMDVNRRSMPASRKDHRNKKSVSSAFSFLQFMRPISNAFSSDTISSTPSQRNADELDFATSGKPTVVLTVADAKTMKFINNERSFTFQVDTDDGGHYLLQAPNQREMAQWMNRVGHISQVTAQRRLTWMGEIPKLPDHGQDATQLATQGPTTVFGIDLTVLLRREHQGEEPPPGSIPIFLQVCLAEVEARGYSETGIYRIAGAKSEINSLVHTLNQGAMPITSSTDIYAICDLIKTWLRQLPESAFPSRFYYTAIAAGEIKDLETRIKAVTQLVHDLPQAHFDLLKRLAEHFYEATEYESQNQMSEGALAIVLHPNLLQAPDFGIAMRNMGAASTLVRTLISHFHVIFAEQADVEDDDPDDTMSSVIAEEDEEEEMDANVPPSLIITDSFNNQIHAEPMAI